MSRRLLVDSKRAKENNIGKTPVLLSHGISNEFEEAGNLIRRQFGNAWEEIRSGRLKVEERAAARLVGQNLDALEKLDSGFVTEQEDCETLRKAAWNVLENGLKNATRSSPGLVATFLKVLFDHFKAGTEGKKDVGELVHAVLETAMQRIVVSMQTESREGVEHDIQFLEHMLEQFREALFDDMDIAQVC
jgi:hypothetical protein